MTIKSEA